MVKPGARTGKIEYIEATLNLTDDKDNDVMLTTMYKDSNSGNFIYCPGETVDFTVSIVSSLACS